MAKAVGPSGHVFAVEPDARALQDLTANCARNGADQVESVPFLLSDRDGFCDFFLSRQLGFSSRFPNEIARPLILDVAEVKARALDRVLADAGKCEQGSLLSFVKVDAEGSEPLVLRGMSHTLERSRPLVWLEVNRSSLQSGGMGVDDVAVVLLALDYRFFRPHFWRTTTGRLRQTLIPLRKLSDESAEAFDLLAVPHGSGLEERAQVLGR
jgi:FkbM family methyltransferase